MDSPSTSALPQNGLIRESVSLPVEPLPAPKETNTALLADRVEAFVNLAAEAVEQGAKAILLYGGRNLRDTRIAVLGARQPGVPVYVLMDTGESGETAEGDSLLACLLCLQELGIAGFGWRHSSPDTDMPALWRELAPYAKVPLIIEESGGLSLLSPAESRPPRPEDAPLLLCAGSGVYYLEEDFTITSSLPCEPDMCGEILEAEDEGSDVLLFHVETLEDAEHLGRNCHLAVDAVGILAESEEALEAALLHYPGRALVDARSDVPEERLQYLAEGYGAVVR
jgi:5-methyltetrahydrofolate--homocysteine methyltransferase